MSIGRHVWKSASFVVLSALIAFGQLDVRIMPGYPNAPHQDPLDRTAVRPGPPFVVWGNVGGGTGAANGSAYVISFSPNPDLAIATDGNLGGTVTNDRFVFEEVSFTLLNGSTREFVDATLTVTNGPNSGSRTVGLVVIDNNDPQSNTALEGQGIDVNIAIQHGLRWLYLNQAANGSWSTSTIAGQFPCAGASFTAWAFQNQGHLPTNDPSVDIYASTVQRALDYILSQVQVLPGISAPNGPGGVSDLNADGVTVNLCPGQDSGYAAPVAAAAIIASGSPDAIVAVPGSPVNGWTYRRVIENFIDWSGQTQSTFSGGWDYNPSNGNARSDMSINSWHYLAMEGAEEVFGIQVPDWIIVNSERSLVSHQSTGDGGVGYAGIGQCTGGSLNRMATTGGGLSGLALVELENGPQGTILATAGAPWNTVAYKRQRALDFLGDNFGYGPPGSYCQGHKGNFYAMWTIARALRLTADALAVPKVSLVNGGVTFDWETGEESGSGALAATGSAREGYFPYLIRTQTNAGVVSDRGQWATGSFLGTTLETAMAVLVLTPRVFLGVNNPPTITVTASGQPQACPVLLPATESVPIAFTVTCTDIDFGDTLSLDVQGLPPGATFSPALPTAGPSPLVVSFNWTPTPAQVGSFILTLTVIDSGQLSSSCVVDIQVGVCMLILGTRPDYLTIAPNAVLHFIPDVWYPVTMEQIPVFDISAPLLQGVTFRAQVFMHNPLMFPSNPMQGSPCVEVTIGQPYVNIFGAGDIDIWPVGSATGSTITIGFDVF